MKKTQELLIGQSRKMKANSPGQNLLAELEIQAKGPLPKDWAEPLMPFVRAADSGVFVPTVGEGETEHETCSRVSREAEDLLVPLVSGHKVKYCQKINAQFRNLVGETAFRAGIDAILDKAILAIGDKPYASLGEHLRRPIDAEVFFRNRSFFEGLTTALHAVHPGAFVGDSNESADTGMFERLSSGMYWRLADKMIWSGSYRFIVPVLVALERYIEAVHHKDRDEMDQIAPWLRVFAVILPIGRLKERPDTWLFYRP